MLKHKTILTLTLVGAVGLTAISCGGGGGSSGGSGGGGTVVNTDFSKSKIDDSATLTSATTLSTTDANGDTLTLTDTGTAIGSSTYYNEATVAPVGAGQGQGGMYRFGSSFQSFGVITNSDEVSAFAAQDFTAALAGAPGVPGADTTVSNVNYAYVDGTVGEMMNAPVQGNDGVINYNFATNKVNGTMGDVQLDGKISGQNITGTATLNGATGTLEGIATSGGVSGGPVMGSAGVFAGDDTDDYAFSGAYIK